VHPGHIWMQSLIYADEIVFIDSSGIFEEPPSVRGKTHYVGPSIRKFTYTRHDRDRARRELGLPLEGKILLVLPGQWFTEDRAPIFDLVMSAYRALPFGNKRLVWFAATDYKRLSEYERICPGLIVRQADWQIDRWMAACDLAITKGTRKTSLELESLGVPSVSLSYGLNPIDDKRAERIATNIQLKVREVDVSRLTTEFNKRLSAPLESPAGDGLPAAGLKMAARRVTDLIDRTRNDRTRNRHASPIPEA
jgi:hypothetical protein